MAKEKTIDEEVKNTENDPEIDKAAEKILELPSGIWKIELSSPIKYLDNEYSELTFAYEKLTGEDVINAEDELMNRHLPIYMNNGVNIHYLLILAAKACEQNISSDALKTLPAVDFNRIISKTKLFLAGIAV